MSANIDLTTTCRSYLKKKIIKNNLLEYKCSECGLKDSWNFKPLCLQLDHINGIRYDNRIENLRFLCPNCHSQQITSNRPIDKRWNSKITEESVKCNADNASSYREILLRLNVADSSANYKKVKSVLNILGIVIERKKRKPVPDMFLPRPHTRKVERPNKEKLIELLKEYPLKKIAEFYKVTDNSIRKWCNSYMIDYKKISPFSHNFKPRRMAEKQDDC